ncbi:MAG: hypothetical protein P1U86_17565 [Verrucomicrobiales bacterium]|nr:hypothetical protein [Verrucomicrobiales bacterium]
MKRFLLVIPLVIAAIATPGASAGDDKAIIVEPDSGPPFHSLFQLDISDHYITPRGLNVENEGVVFQPLALFFFDLYSDPNAFLSNVSLTAGVWNSIHTNESGADPGYWNEVDPILGLTFKFGEHWTFDSTFTQFVSQTDSYPDSTHMELKLSFDDSEYLGAFALRPWLGYWLELDQKSTVVFDPATSEESYYFTVGVKPEFSIGSVKFEFPTSINLVGEEFYQQFDGTGGGSGLAVFSSGVKASVPMTFMPEDFGNWTFYTGVRYYNLSNDGLRNGNRVLTPNEHRDDLVQFHSGISVFF